MPFVFAQPQAIATAVADVSGIGSAIGAANAGAAGATTGLQAAAADEVSAATANLFNAYAQEYQALLRQAQSFHDAFARALTGAATAYAATESAAATALGASGTAGTTALATSTTPVQTALILGASGVPIPDAKYIATAYGNYVSRNFTTSNIQGLFTPEGLYPITGIKDLTLNISVDRGLTILNNALTGPNAPTQPVTVFGYSQGAILAALELPNLVAAHVPTSDVSFVLVGNEMTPNGGMLARFPGLDLPSLGIPFYGGMASNTGYSIYNYTLEYDGFADFPQYPIDILADLNAFAGIAFVHGTYLTIPATQISQAITLPVSPGYDGGSTYYMIPTHNLPLLDPLRLIPGIGNPLADLLQPDLRYLVNWGYGDPNYGYSTGYANVTTPFGVLPPLNATLALGPDLLSGAYQGILAAGSDLSAQGLPSLSLSAPALASLGGAPPAVPTGISLTSALDGAISGLENANTGFANALASDVSTAYATLLPTADIATALVVTLPSYDANLFLNGITQAINGQPLQGLANAIGQPIAADVGLGTLAGGVEFLTVASALDTILTGTPHPSP
ncbi:PE family protein [Mycobacterium helveticum]|uniref:PE-PPE domain-containing protein n=1 Tax=Mycobacterium helveticum TaxID=2592811 RepID=A0A557Y1T4_9MYCO|nr:PE-PPE domain-containing protein [Mycobacterium helveticum]TVS89298.1 PE-PPE domain-containing protein [Mycobacterium helveticum]TVS92514.1 PE-PPE domain-containing protein [Mycobacterium helveticum]